jgi:hypothetical protein
MDTDLRQLIRRRLFELGVTAHEVALRSRGAVPLTTLRALAHGLIPVRPTDRLVAALARVLDVPEYRIRRAAGLPVAEPTTERTHPHLRLVGRDECS